MTHYHKLMDAIAQGQEHNLLHLLPLPTHDDPNVSLQEYSVALLEAAEQGHAECVKLLLKYCDDLAKDTALQGAVVMGQLNVVREIIPHCDPKFNHSYALRLALSEENHDIFEVLYEVSDPKDALDFMNALGQEQYTQALVQRLAQEENAHILDNINIKQNTKRKRVL